MELQMVLLTAFLYTNLEEKIIYALLLSRLEIVKP